MWEKQVTGPDCEAQKHVDDCNERIKMKLAVVKKMKARFKYARPKDEKDVAYRLKVYSRYGIKLFCAIKQDNDLCFHGTSLAAAESIIKDGKIEGDQEHQIYVSTSGNIERSVQGYLNLDQELLPAGVLFVVKAQNKEEYALAEQEYLMQEVDFKKNPERLVAIISTPENFPMLRKLCAKNGVDPDKVFDFGAFIAFAKHYGEEDEKDI